MAQHKYPISIEYSPGDGGAGSALGSAGSEVLVPHPLLAVGSYDGNVRLLSTRTWAVAFVLPAAHTSEMTAIMHQGVVTTVEIVNAEESTDLFSFVTKSAVNSTRLHSSYLSSSVYSFRSVCYTEELISHLELKRSMGMRMSQNL